MFLGQWEKKLILYRQWTVDTFPLSVHFSQASYLEYAEIFVYF